MDKSLLIQKQIKDNADDLQNYVRDLKLWEEEMKRKDRLLSKEPKDEALPPVRRPKLSNKSLDQKDEKKVSVKKKLTSYDYSSWDKFDVDKACEEIDNEDSKKEENDEETPELQEKYLKEKALYEKELGNKHVKASRWDEAIGCYTRAIEAYPKDPVFFANRALCHLKTKKYEMVEADCTASLKLDPTYVKAMLRRAAAREFLGRAEGASYDLTNALKLEPNNSQALRDLERLKGMNNKKISTAVSSKEATCKVGKESILQNMTPINEVPKASLPLQPISGHKIIKEHSPDASTSEPDWSSCSNTVQPVVKPPHMRSKKSLKRIEIYDVGPNTPEHVCAAKLQRCENIPNTQKPSRSLSVTQSGTVVPSAIPVKPRSILTVTSPSEDIPPPPTTSVQLHTAWNSIKTTPQLCYRYLKQIPGENFPDIFKDALESHMFSSIVETLASEFTLLDDPVLSYLKGLTRVKRFSTLTLFMSPSDKSNLIKLFDYCIKKAECTSEEIQELRRIYEIS